MMNNLFAQSLSAIVLFFLSGLLLAQPDMDTVRMRDLSWMPCDPNASDGACQLAIIRGTPAKDADNSTIVLIRIRETTGGGADRGQEQEAMPGVAEYVYIPPKRLFSPGQCMFYGCVEGPNIYYLREKK